jgi:hypothetical protein
MAAESRKVIIALDETPSASGTLLGSDLPTCCFSVQEINAKQRIINAKDDLFKFFFIESGLRSY